MSETASTFINPLTDFGFKYLFGEEANKKFIISFLNSLMGNGKRIEDVEFVDKEKVNQNKEGRALIYDIHCKTADGGKIIVEMQNRTQSYFDDRALFYLSGDIYLQGRKGKDWDYRLTPVYGIFIMNFDWKDNFTQEIREDVALVNLRSLKLFSDKLKLTFLKIPLMNKTPDECKSALDKWLYLMKHMEDMKAMPTPFLKDPVFKDLNDVAQIAALPAEKRKSYERSLKAYRDWYAIVKTERAEGEMDMLRKNVASMRSKGLSDAEIADLLNQSPSAIASL